MKELLVADLFCGAGGATTGALRAARTLRLKLDLLAVNHWPIAVETHALNHPHVRHLCEAIERVNPREAVPGGRLHLLIAAPECTNHSRARGGRPVNDQSRATAWHILKWLQELYVDNLLIENVEEFREWGPLGAHGKPLKSGKGQTYRAFLQAIESLGYRVEDRVLNAADYGDPTTRRRLFIIARRGRRPIVWPTPTHSRTGGATLFGETKRWRPARDVIDWSLQGKSIFGRKKPLSPKTEARILAGLERFGGAELQPFLLVLRNHMGARSLDEPLPALAAGGQHVGLVEPFLMHLTHGTDVGRTHPLDKPLPTVTGAHRGEIALVEPFVLGQHGGAVARQVEQPLPTITTDGAIALVQPFILPPLRFNPTRTASVDAPLPTVTATGGRLFGLVEPFLIPNYGEREGQTPRTHSVDEPVPTIPASGAGKFGVVEPFLVAYHSERAGEPPRVHSVDDPLGTLTTENRFAVAEPFISSYYGTQNISPVSAPLPTVTTKDRFALVMPVVDGRALDIRLRMLKPHELARAMSFGDDYQFAGNQGDQVKQIGNAWACRLGEALISVLIEGYATNKKPTRLEAIA